MALCVRVCVGHGQHTSNMYVAFACCVLSKMPHQYSQNSKKGGAEEVTARMALDHPAEK